MTDTRKDYLLKKYLKSRLKGRRVIAEFNIQNRLDMFHTNLISYTRDEFIVLERDFLQEIYLIFYDIDFHNGAVVDQNYFLANETINLDISRLVGIIVYEEFEKKPVFLSDFSPEKLKMISIVGGMFNRTAKRFTLVKKFGE